MEASTKVYGRATNQLIRLWAQTWIEKYYHKSLFFQILTLPRQARTIYTGFEHLTDWRIT